MFIVPLVAGGVMGPNCSIEEVGKWELFGKIDPEDVSQIVGKIPKSDAQAKSGKSAALPESEYE